MRRYTVKLYSQALRDLDGIYAYISENIRMPVTAGRLIDALEEAILGLEIFPEKGSVRDKGDYTNKGYRQISVKNYLIIYKVLKDKKEVHVVTVQYSARNIQL